LISSSVTQFSASGESLNMRSTKRVDSSSNQTTGPAMLAKAVITDRLRKQSPPHCAEPKSWVRAHRGSPKDWVMTTITAPYRRGIKRPIEICRGASGKRRHNHRKSRDLPKNGQPEGSSTPARTLENRKHCGENRYITRYLGKQT
jgi:hypothetical protein